MSRISDAITRLQHAPGGFYVGLLAHPVDAIGVLRRLQTTADRIVASVGGTVAGPSAPALERARKRWSDIGQKYHLLSSRERRILCGDRETAPTLQFLTGAASDPELPSRRRWIENLMSIYFAEWGALIEEKMLEEILQRAVLNFEGKSKWIAACHAEAREIFSRRAADILAHQALDTMSSVAEVLPRFMVQPTTRLAHVAMDEAVLLWLRQETERRPSYSDSDALTSFRYLRHSLLPPDSLTSENFGRVISSVVLWEGTVRNEALLHEVVDFVLSDLRLGDPRLPKNAANWSLCDPAAKQRIVSLRARQDLAFFFDFVIQDNRDPHGRKSFWLRYVDRVEDSQVALSREDAMRLRTYVDEKYSYAQIVDSTDASAFLMKFRGAGEVIFVEFSRTGNALYIHDSEKFRAETNKSLRSRAFSLVRDLKHATRLSRVNHTSRWQSHVSNVLSRLGIRPV